MRRLLILSAERRVGAASGLPRRLRTGHANGSSGAGIPPAPALSLAAVEVSGRWISDFVAVPVMAVAVVPLPGVESLWQHHFGEGGAVEVDVDEVGVGQPNGAETCAGMEGDISEGGSVKADVAEAAPPKLTLVRMASSK